MCDAPEGMVPYGRPRTRWMVSVGEHWTENYPELEEVPLPCWFVTVTSLVQKDNVRRFSHARSPGEFRQVTVSEVLGWAEKRIAESVDAMLISRTYGRN